VFLDTEAWRDKGPVEERQRWRLGCSATLKWRPDSATWSPAVVVRHVTPEALWEAVSAFTRKDCRTVAVAHNIGYDLRLSRAFTILPALGWEVGKLTLSGEHITLDLHRDGATLVLVDSLTVLTTSVKVLSEWKGTEKPALPDDDADEELWWDRCTTDVQTLAWAYMEIVDWIVRDDLGGWARTGSGIGWHTLLRGHLSEKVLVHNNPDLLKLEGESCYAGRAEAWQPGDWTGTRLDEWDYELAYCSVMEDERLPARYLDCVRSVPLARMVKRSDALAYLCHATVTTTVPVLPWRDQNGVCWPVGTFNGWWWHWELAEAEAAGAQVKVGEAHRYAASPWLASWAAWAREVIEDHSTPEARVRSVVAKHWTRAVVGRSAMRFKAWEHMGQAWRPGVSYWRMVDHDTGKLGAALQLGDQRWEAWEERWWDSALPQVLSAVMAHVRVRLWRALVVAGLDNVVYCDTDCLLVGTEGSALLRAATASEALPGLRLKSSHDDLEIMAPQLVEGSSYRRLSGIPRQAKRTGPHSYEAECWEGIASTLASEDPSIIRVTTVHPKLEMVDWRRKHGGARTSEPYRVERGEREVPAGVTRNGPAPARPRQLRPYQS